MLNVTVFCFFASYLLALVFEISRAVGQRSWLRWPAFFAALAGLVAHTFFLWNRGRALDLPPLLASPQDWMFVVAWIACVLYLFVVAYDRRVGIGLFALPVVLLFVVVGNFASSSTSLGAAAEQGAFRGWLLLHAALLGLGIAAVMAGVVLSVMYLVQHNRLKHKRAPAVGFKLLSLERLAQWNHFSILIAVPLLTLGLVVGVLLVFLGRRQGTNLTLYDPFVIASSLAWLVMIVVLGRALRPQQPVGKTVAIRTLLAFGLLLTTLLGLQLATGGGHTQGIREDQVTHVIGGRGSGVGNRLLVGRNHAFQNLSTLTSHLSPLNPPSPTARVFCSSPRTSPNWSSESSPIRHEC